MCCAIARRKETAGQRVIRDHPQSLVAAEGKYFTLDLAVQQVVTGLDAVEAGHLKTFADAQGQGALPGRKIGAAHVTNFALAYQILKRTQGFFNGRVWVRGVRLVEVEVVGPQAAQAIFSDLENMAARKSLIIGSGARSNIP